MYQSRHREEDKTIFDIKFKNWIQKAFEKYQLQDSKSIEQFWCMEQIDPTDDAEVFTIVAERKLCLRMCL